jgi:pectate lyase
MKKQLFLFAFTLLAPVYMLAQAITINESAGWLETAYVKWAPFSGASSYNVYYSGMGIIDKKIDTPLIRSYGTYYRADVLGIAAGTYTLKVVPVVGGVENTAATATTPTLIVQPNIREGFAFQSAGAKFVPGAYNEDGTPKTGAKIIYVSANTVNTVTCNVINEKKVAIPITGLVNILIARGKGYDKTPLIIRMIGLIKGSQIPDLMNSSNYIAFIGANATDRLIENITFEGVGDDATAHGYGFYTKRSKGIEIRNVGIMMFGDDGVSMEADNFNNWVHNCDFFYGKPGSDADQVKGDGSIDMKYNTTNITVSFNHFWDSGKTTFAGGADEANPIYFTYHHNWFDHSDSRHARICHATVHMYNNYHDANSTMCLLNTENSCAFIEANCYRNCPYPMMINMQGTNYEKWPDGTQNGGMTKAYNNEIDVVTKLIYQTVRPTDFDAYLVTTRNEQIPATVISKKGGNTYSNFDTAPTMYAYTPDSPDSVRNIVTASAGRLNGGDLKWSFTAADENSGLIIPALKTAIVNYSSKLVAIQGENNSNTAVSNPLSKRIDIYPNPVVNVLKVSSDEAVNGIEIYSLAGVLVQTAKAGTTSLDLSNLTSGMYLAIVNTEKGRIQKIIIKQ